MDNRNIWIHSNGAINRTINKAYAETITDNVYTYASDADYYICAMKVYEQEYTLLQGNVDVETEDVIYDSRKAASGKVFVAMKGIRADGQQLYPSATYV